MVGRPPVIRAVSAVCSTGRKGRCGPAGFVKYGATEDHKKSYKKSPGWSTLLPKWTTRAYERLHLPAERTAGRALRGNAMRLSAKTRYATRILYYLVKNKPSGPVSSNIISTQTGISSQFVEQIMRQLRLAGITGSIRGARGGHVLLQPPDKLTFGCIMRLMEGGIELGCSRDRKAESCAQLDDCEVHKAWLSLQGSLDSVLESMSLNDILKYEEILEQHNSQVRGGLS